MCFIVFSRRIMIFVHRLKCTRWLSKHTLYLKISVKLFHAVFRYTAESSRQKLNDCKIILCKNYSAIRNILVLQFHSVAKTKLKCCRWNQISISILQYQFNESLSQLLVFSSSMIALKFVHVITNGILHMLVLWQTSVRS